jgi:hypothetical protein
MRAIVVGYGGLLTLTRLRFYRHYLLLGFPLAPIGVATLAQPYLASDEERSRGRRVLAAIWLGLALLTGTTLTWIHQREVIRGDYGITYARQVRDATESKGGAPAGGGPTSSN